MCNEKRDGRKYGYCECIGYETEIQPDGLAKAYVPFQNFCPIYSGCKGLVRGTIFPELDKPYKKNCRKKTKTDCD